MKKFIGSTLSLLIVFVLLQEGCNNSTEKKADNNQVAVLRPQDTLKAFIEVTKMEAKAFTMVQPGYYDSALARYNKCLQYVNQVLAANNNKGIYLFENPLIEINQGMETAYDSMQQPENSIKCALECVKWAKRTNDNTVQVKLDVHVADKFKTMATQITPKDTAKKGALLRQALLYSVAAVRVIDSLKNNDMDDVKYESFHQTSKIYALLGDKKQAQLYDKKYRDVYFSIYKKQPTDR